MNGVRVKTALIVAGAAVVLPTVTQARVIMWEEFDTASAAQTAPYTHDYNPAALPAAGPLGLFGNIGLQKAYDPGGVSQLSANYTDVTQINGVTGYTNGARGNARIGVGQNTLSGRTVRRDLVQSRFIVDDTYYFSGTIRTGAATTNVGGRGYMEWSNGVNQDVLARGYSDDIFGITSTGAFGTTDFNWNTADKGFQIGLGELTSAANKLFVRSWNSDRSAMVETASTTNLVVAASSNSYFTNLWVAKLQVNASGTDDILTVFLNSTDVTSEAQAQATAQEVMTVTGNFVDAATDLSRFGLCALRNNNAVGALRNVTVDEGRMGTEFIDVVVPEPASLGVLALGGLMLARRRK